MNDPVIYLPIVTYVIALVALLLVFTSRGKRTDE